MAATLSEFEEAFQAILTATDDALVKTGELHTKTGLDGLQLEGYPSLTLIRLERQVTLEMRGAVDLLRNPLLAWNGEILNRALLETMAQIFRIYGHKRASLKNRRRRAICFEFGSIAAIRRSISPRRDKVGRRLPSRLGFSTAESRASIRERYKDLNSLHDLTCPPGCRGTSYRGVGDTLLRLSRRHREVNWAWPLYEVTSQTAHQMLMRGLASAPAWDVTIQPMEIQGRLSWLDRLVVSYGVSLQLISEIHQPELARFKAVAVALKKGLNGLRDELVSAGLVS